MELSQAIRLGSLMKPQCVGHAFSNEKTCALGAAVDAMGKLELVAPFSNIVTLTVDKIMEYEKWMGDTFPIIYKIVMNPVTKELASVGRVIVDLNDKQVWTREKIADWVESVEKAVVAERLSTPLPTETTGDRSSPTAPEVVCV